MTQPVKQTVVLMGHSIEACRRLSQQLQVVDWPDSLAFVFHCPETPRSLADLPDTAIYLLWKVGAADQATFDHADWRQALQALRRTYQTLHADWDHVRQHAVYALSNGQHSGLSRPQSHGRWQGMCESCADPACEQRLFAGLLQR